METAIEQTAKPRGTDFTFPEGGLDLPRGKKSRYKANAEAIKLARQLEEEGRPATPEEQTILSHFVGWGGLAEAFDADKADWKREYAELKELFSDAEWRAARQSTQNAHYTSGEVIQAIYHALTKLGFTGGRMLEPSAGIGHFNGAMPENLRKGVKSWTMVELDPLTGKILKALYPNADVRIGGFQDTKIPQNYMDVCISNVPFGSYGVTDDSYPDYVTRSIHNYFIAKMLDSTRPGGLTVAITSSYTLDSMNADVRKYFRDRADLLGAIRLPETAFQQNADTSVVTDVLIFKKRPPKTIYAGQNFDSIEYKYFTDPATGKREYVYLNSYYVQHPEMILGDLSMTGKLHGKDSMTVLPRKGSLGKQIETALGKLDGKMEYPEKPTPEVRIRDAAKGEKAGKMGQVRRGDGGKLVKTNSDGEEEEVQLPGWKQARLGKAIDLRDKARELLRMQQDGVSAADIAKARAELNELYDDFVKHFKFLHSRANVSIIRQDVDSPFIFALEDWDKDSETGTKAAIFTQNTLTPARPVTHADTIDDALTVSLNTKGRVDLPSMAALMGKSQEAVRRELLDGDLAYLNRDGELETPDTYLSGNVRQKLRDAEALVEGNPEYRRNVDALKKIIPADIAPEDIKVNLGAAWVPDSVYTRFAQEFMGIPRVMVHRSGATGAFTFNYAYESYARDAKYSAKHNVTWMTTEKSALDILDGCLNSKQIEVNHDGKRDDVATAAARQKQKELDEAFSRWLWDDKDRREELARLYNEKLNNLVPPTYDGSRLQVAGMRAGFQLRPFQANAVQRIVMGQGNTLLDHCVGAGKTFTIAASCMKMRELGTAKKPLIVAPKGLTAQWGGEFYKFFPGAHILLLGENDFTPGNRKETANRIATGDWDAVILSYEQFAKIPMSLNYRADFLSRVEMEYEYAIYEAKDLYGEKAPSVRKLANALDRLKKRLKKLMKKVKRDEGNIDFEDLGADALFVDEAHAYKNLYYASFMDEVGGMGSKEGNGMTFDMLMKTKYLNEEVTHGRNICFATATPMANAIPEIFNMQRYLDPEGLKAAGVENFDAWAKQFGTVEEFRQQKIGGGYEKKNFLTRYRNIPELQRMLRSFMDVVRQLPESVKVPKMKGGKRIVVECESSPLQAEFFRKLGERAKNVKGFRHEKGDDNALAIYTDGRKAAISQKLVDPSLPFEPEGKISTTARKVYDVWKRTADRKGTQIVFLDMSVPGETDTKKDSKKNGKQNGKHAAQTDAETDADETFDTDPEAAALAEKEDEGAVTAYAYIKNQLIGMGVPADEIAFIHEANSQDKRKALFKAMNEGKVRVLLGSTGKMGVGMNAQNKVVALHHINPPFRPADIEQREGRAIRQGNENDEVEVYVYVTKGSLDTRMWQNIERKQRAIDQIQEGSLNAREMEGDSAFAVSAAEIASIASGDPLIAEQFEVGQKLEDLENLQRAHQREAWAAQGKVWEAQKQLKHDKTVLPGLKADLSAMKEDTRGENFRMTVQGTLYDKRKDAGQAILSLASKAMKAGTTEEAEIGAFNGLTLLTEGKTGNLLLRGETTHRIEANFQSPAATVQKVENVKSAIAREVQATEARIAQAETAIPEWEAKAKAAFPQEDELNRLRVREREIADQMDNQKEKPAEPAAEDTKPDTPPNLHARKSPPHLEGKDAPKKPRPRNPDDWTTTRTREGRTKNTPLKSLGELSREIQERLGVHITIGHLDDGRLLGQYRDDNQGIRIKITNDLPTIAHELGHHLEHEYALTTKVLDNRALRELMDGLPVGMKGQYTPEEKLGEGLAEFVRKFLRNSDEARNEYKTASDAILDALTPKDRAALLDLADKVNATLSQGANESATRIRLPEEMKDRSPLWQKVRRKFPAFYQAWVDSNYGIKVFDEATGGDTYTLATNSLYSDAVAANNVLNFLSDPDGGYRGPGLATVLYGLNMDNTEEFRDFGDYLVAKHGPERLAEGLQVYANDVWDTPEWMNARAAELEEKYPKFKEISERLYDFQTEFLKIWVLGTGRMTQKQYNDTIARWKYYVPFNRAFYEDERQGGGRGGKHFANQDSGIKRARGSGRDYMHPVINILNNVVKQVTKGMNNNVLVSLTNSAIAHDANANFLEQIPEEKRKALVPTPKEEIKGAVDEADLAAEEKQRVLDILEGLDDYVSQYQEGKPHGDIITVMENGERQWWKVNDRPLLESLVNLGRVKSNAVSEAYGMISKMMTSNITGNNIVWAVTSNSLRDSQTFATYTDKKEPARWAAAIGSAYLNQIREARGQDLDPLYMEYLAMGGGHESAYSADVDMTRKLRQKLARKVSGDPPVKNAAELLGAGFEAMRLVSDTIEMGPRYATYRMCRENGLTPQEAFYAAYDITVNFRRGGALARSLNKLIPYFNASIQGFDKFVRYFGASDVKPGPDGKARNAAVRRRVLTWALSSIVLGALMYALNGADDERRREYEQLSVYLKNSFWCIPTGDGRYFAIPKARELSTLSSFTERLLERFHGGNKDAFKDFYSYAEEQFLPSVVSDFAAFPYQAAQEGLSPALKDTGSKALGSLGIIGVFSYMLSNRDFRGVPIVSRSMEFQKPRDQYSRSTSLLAFRIGRAFNVSPAMVDFFGENVFGGPYKWQKAALPVGAETRDLTLGVGRQFNKDNTYSTDFADWLYDRRDKNQMEKNSNPNSAKDALAYKLDDNLASFYSAVLRLARADGEQERDIRRDALDMIYSYKTAIQAHYQTPAEKAVYAVLDTPDAVSDCLLSVMSTSVKDGDGTDHELTARQYMDFQTAYNGYYWNTVETAMPMCTTDDEKRAVLKTIKTAARELAANDTLAAIGAPQRKSDEDYSSLALVNVPMAVYAVAKARASTVESLKGRDGKTIPNSKSAQIVEKLMDPVYRLSDTQRKALGNVLGVGKTVLEWSASRLERELRSMRREVGIN